MSRSRRKPFITLGYGSSRRRYNKRQANKSVRISEDVPNGKAYKKFYCSWNICDYRFNVPPPRHGGIWYFSFSYRSEEEMTVDYRKARRK